MARKMNSDEFMEEMNRTIREGERGDSSEEQRSASVAEEAYSAALADQARKREELSKQRTKEAVSPFSKLRKFIPGNRQAPVEERKARGYEEGGVAEKNKKEEIPIRTDASIISEALGLEEKEKDPKEVKDDKNNRFRRLRDLLTK